MNLIPLPAALLAAVFSFSLASSAPSPAKGMPTVLDRLRAGQTTRIVCFGDSITGVYYHTGSRIAYADLVGQGLRRLFPRARIEVVNAGVSGDVTAGGLKRMDRDVLRRKPHLVVIMFGMNDVVATPLETFLANLRTMLARCRAAGADALLCTQNPIFPTDPRRPVERLERFTQAIRDLAREAQTPLADCYAAFETIRKADPRRWAVLLMDHDIHPSLDGHRIFAQVIIERITGVKLPLSAFTNSPVMIPHTLAKWKAGRPIRVTAVGLDASDVETAMKTAFRGALVSVEARPAPARSIPALARQAKRLFASRDDDLLLIAFPRQTAPLNDYQWMHALFLINYASIPFSPRARPRDVVWVLPSVLREPASPLERQCDELLKHKAYATDLGGVQRSPADGRPPAELLGEWLRGQTHAD